MTDPVQTLGIIAGNRSLPMVVAKQARALGVQRLIAVAFEGETNSDLTGLVDEIAWLKVGQLVKLIDTFKRHNVTRCVMVGQIAPKNLFDLRPDFRAMAMLFKLKEKNAHTIFGAIVGELQKEGIEVIEPTQWLKPIMPQTGYCAGPKLTPQANADLAFGFRIAKEISRLEIGQTVVVKNGTVLAVEGFEGTDACLRRGGELAGRDGAAIAVKVAKENHDLRFDIPCIGPQTLETCASAGIKTLGVEGQKTLWVEQEEIERLAQAHRISVAAI